VPSSSKKERQNPRRGREFTNGSFPLCSIITLGSAQPELGPPLHHRRLVWFHHFQRRHYGPQHPTLAGIKIEVKYLRARCRISATPHLKTSRVRKEGTCLQKVIVTRISDETKRDGLRSTYRPFNVSHRAHGIVSSLPLARTRFEAGVLSPPPIPRSTNDPVIPAAPLLIACAKPESGKPPCHCQWAI